MNASELGSDAIEILAQFDGAVLDVHYLTCATDSYTVGAAAGAHLTVAPNAVPLPRFPLVRRADGGGFELAFTPAMAGSLTVGDSTRALDDGARPSPTLPGVRVQPLPTGARAWVRVGDALFNLARVPAPRRLVGRPRTDWGRARQLAVVAAVVGAFVLFAWLVPPEPQSLALDAASTRRFAHFVIAPPALPPPPKTPGAPADGGRAGARARGPAGLLGKPTAPRRTGALALPGPPSRDKQLAAAHAAAAQAGIVSLLGEGTQVGSLFGPGDPLGDGAPALLSGLGAEAPRDGYGSGADLAGSGPGGDGARDATIGVGPLGTVGFCPGCRHGDTAYVRHAPAADRAHHAAAPEIVPGLATVRCGVDASCIDREIVRRVVREHHNEVRFCYERALLRHPLLGGRVVIRFTIATTGRVLGAGVVASSVADPAVGACIADAVRRWQFPASAQTAIVSYPFVLAPPR